MTAKNLKKVRFSHPLVRDLADIMGSPSLYCAPDTISSARFESFLEKHMSWLKELDEHPERLLPLEKELHKKKPLGKHYEDYLLFWLKESPLFELILANRQIVQNGKTLGELDYIVREKESGKTFHWEVAVKFYLAYGESGSHNNFIGPNGKDRLDKKLDKLKNKQLPLLRSEAAKTRLPLSEKEEIISRIVLKGMLFYHPKMKKTPPKDACTDHQQGVWVKLKELKSLEEKSRKWSILSKKQWIWHTDNLINNDDLEFEEVLEKTEKLLSGDRRNAVMLRMKTKNDYQKVMVVRDNWPERK